MQSTASWTLAKPREKRPSVSASKASRWRYGTVMWEGKRERERISISKVTDCWEPEESERSELSRKREREWGSEDRGRDDMRNEWKVWSSGHHSIFNYLSSVVSFEKLSGRQEANEGKTGKSRKDSNEKGEEYKAMERGESLARSKIWKGRRRQE